MLDDKYSSMWAMLIKKLNSQEDKVISVAGNKTPALGRGSFQLFHVSGLQHSNLMGTDSSYMILSEYFCNPRAEVFVEIIFQRLPVARKGYFS